MRLKEVDMTKAFLNWLISLGPKPEGWSEYEVLRAFVKEINRREDECDNSGLGCPYESRSQCRGDKLRSLVREFGLDGEK
jgi:hypothetical protein